MDLPLIPDNPPPAGMAVETVITADGVKLRAASWRPAGRTRGTVCLFQGRAEAIEKYHEVAGELLRRGFAVATLDWRGQGGSDRRLRDRRKGHVEDFAEYELDLDAFLQQVALADCPPPYFALAHSTGALVCLRAARRTRLTFSRMVLVGPLLALGAMNPPQWFVGAAAGVLAQLGLGDAFPPGAGLVRIEERGFDGNPLTSDPRRFARTMAIGRGAPELSIGPPTIGWLQAACRAMAEAMEPEFAASVRIPTLIISAGEDRVVDPLSIERFVRHMRLGSQIVIPGARHEILMERDSLRSLLWAAFDAFIPGEG